VVRWVSAHQHPKSAALDITAQQGIFATMNDNYTMSSNSESAHGLTVYDQSHIHHGIVLRIIGNKLKIQ
jgi:hypothetical protein